MDRQSEIEQIIDALLAGVIDRAQASDKLLYEMGRGSRILVADENLFGLDQELSAMNYTLSGFAPGMDDGDIKNTLRSRVFITRNGKDFCNPKDLQKYRYGLIWITSRIKDNKLLAKMIKDIMMTSNFSGNLMQVVKI